jgi:hypothetical protein
MVSKMLLVAQAVALTCLAISSPARATPQTDGAASLCSNDSLSGAYGKLYGGAAVDGTPTASVQKITFDPATGTLSSYTTASHNGVIASASVPGIYAVAANCTVAAAFVVGPMKNEFSMVLTSTGFLYTSQWAGATTEGFGVKQGSPTCTKAGVAGRYGFEATGVFVAGAPVTGPVALIGPLQFTVNSLGEGTIGGRLAGSENGTIDTFAGDPVTGSYTVDTNCWGKATITPKGRSDMHFNFLVTDNGKQILAIETDANTVLSGTLVKGKPD